MSEQKVNDQLSVEWDERVETILKGWGEKASCYQLMHDRSHKKYWLLNSWFAIPIIILSTLTGTANFAQESFAEIYKYYVIYTIASINILIAILQTISQYLTIGQLVEGHRIASINWDKFSRNIKVELSKSKLTRTNAGIFISQCQETYDRLIEITPNLPQDSIEWMKKLVATGKNLDNMNVCFRCCCFPFGCKGFICRCCNKKKYEERILANKKAIDNIQLPEILGKLTPILINTPKLIENEYSIYNIEN